MSDQEVKQTLEDYFKEVADLLKSEKREPKIVSRDGLWNIREQELRVRQDLDSKISVLEGAINLADRVLRLRGQPGWQDFVRALEDMRIYRRQELELSTSTDSELRILQGRCRELGAILALVKNAEKNREALASQLKSLQDERDAIVRPDGKVQPQGV